MTHATLAPSAADQWGPGRCAASVAMQQAHPQDDDTEAAREGTAAHHVATTGEDCTHAPNGVPIDDDMRDGAAMYREALERRDAPPWTHEQRVSLQWLHPECYGTPDSYAVCEVTRNVWIADYKYGHRYVDAYRNPQLTLYAMGVMHEHVGPPETWRGWRVHYIIVQPRSYRAPSQWQCSGEALADEVPRYRKAAYAALAPGAEAVTGDWCRDCTARHDCGAFWLTVGNSLDVARRAERFNPSPAAVGSQMIEIEAAIKRLRAMQSGLEQAALGLVRSGSAVPGWRAETKQERLAWTVPVEEVIELGEVLGVELSKPGVVTPTQAKKLLDPAVIAQYAARPSGGVALVRDDGSAADRVFTTS